LKRYDRPLPLYDASLGRITAEHITRFSSGCFIYPPLVIDEAQDSLIRSSHEMGWHQDYNRNFCPSEYAAADIAAGNRPLILSWLTAGYRL
jgi:hypothetical protein